MVCVALSRTSLSSGGNLFKNLSCNLSAESWIGVNGFSLRELIFVQLLTMRHLVVLWLIIVSSSNITSSAFGFLSVSLSGMQLPPNNKILRVLLSISKISWCHSSLWSSSLVSSNSTKGNKLLFFIAKNSIFWFRISLSCKPRIFPAAEFAIRILCSLLMLNTPLERWSKTFCKYHFGWEHLFVLYELMRWKQQFVRTWYWMI